MNHVFFSNLCWGPSLPETLARYALRTISEPHEPSNSGEIPIEKDGSICIFQQPGLMLGSEHVLF